MRLFFALWPPAAAASTLNAWAKLAAGETGGRVTRAETIHLTLSFLGEVPEGEVSSAITAARRARVKPHALAIETARFWPRNHVVWVGPQEIPEQLQSLFDSLRGNLLEAGFDLERRPFSAHVTLIRKARAPRALPPLPRIEWPVNEMVLVRSMRSAQGSRYEFVERFAFAA